MCGIVGLAGKITAKEKEIFKQLLIVCQFRGLDATGAIAVDKQNHVSYAKALGTPDQLFDTRRFTTQVDKFNTKVLIGHCRAKTMGGNTVMNAHPFQHGDITGVHNGTLRNWRTGKNASTFDVDSSYLYSEIADNGIEDVIPRTEGAWCLNYWNAEDNTLNFLRNDERPLHFCWSEDKETMFWASEAWMLYVVSRSVKVLRFEDGFTRSLAEDELWSFHVNEGKDMFRAKPVKKLEGAKGYTAPFLGSRGWGGVQTGASTNSNTNSNTNPNNVVDFRQPTVGGSSVKSPFLLNDEIDDIGKTPPLVTKDGTPLVRTSTSSPSKGGSNSSLIPSASSTESTNGRPSSRGTLSLPSQSTEKSPTTNKSENSVSSTDGSQRKASNKGVSFRVVSGLKYVTDNRTGIEYVEHVVRVNTGNLTCSWCQNETPFFNIASFVTPHKFLCRNCNSDS